MIGKQELIDAYNRISPYIHKTPVFTSQTLNYITGAQLYFKCENFQKMGAFKMRGAMNAVLQLTDEEKERGVVTHSSGNFAQALSLSCKHLGIKSFIIMPSDSPQVKKDAVRGYGGIIIECKPTLAAREETAMKIIEEKHAVLIHPFDSENVIAGQGTACMELLEEQPDIEMIVVPVGGGGLISGSALAAKYFGTNCKTIGAEPFEADDAFRSLQSGMIEMNVSTNTIADGLKTQLSSNTFSIINKNVERIIRLTEREIAEAMITIWERMKIIIEPSGAIAYAAIKRKRNYFKGKKTGVILSGGNFDLMKLTEVMKLINHDK